MQSCSGSKAELLLFLGTDVVAGKYVSTLTSETLPSLIDALVEKYMCCNVRYYNCIIIIEIGITESGQVGAKASRTNHTVK